MKISRIFLLGSSVFFFASTPLFAQDETDKVTLKKDFEIQKHTIMERFETDYMITVEERADLKKKRIADAEHTLKVLDTMKISNRKRKLLLHDLKYNPFSTRLNQFIVDTKFEDDEDGIKQE